MLCCFRYLEILQFKLTPENKLQSMDVKVELKQASKSIDYGWHMIASKEMNGDMPHVTVNSTVRYAAQKTAKASLDINIESIEPIKASSEAILETPDNRFIYREKIAQKPGKAGFDGELFLSWAPDKSARHTYEIKLGNSDSMDNMQVVGKITGDGYDGYPIEYHLKKRITNMDVSMT